MGKTNTPDTQTVRHVVRSELQKQYSPDGLLETFFNKLIDAAMVRFFEAMNRHKKQIESEAVKATGKRIGALPILRDRLKDKKEELDDLETYGSRTRSKSIMRYSTSGSRLTPEEKLECEILDLKADITRTEREIETVEKALGKIADDYYYFAVTGKYEYDMRDADIAEKLSCDASTVYRNRERLFPKVVTYLYGVMDEM